MLNPAETLHCAFILTSLSLGYSSQVSLLDFLFFLSLSLHWEKCQMWSAETSQPILHSCEVGCLMIHLLCFSVSMFLCMCNPKRQKRKMIQSLSCNQTTMPKQNQIKMNTFNYKAWWCITYLCVYCCCCGITELLRSLWQTLNSSTGEGLAFIYRWVELHGLRAQRSWICARGETGGRKQDLCERETTTGTACLQHYT